MIELPNVLQGRVVSGHVAALDVVQEAAVKKGALKAARLAVSGAFHTPLMQPARDALVKVTIATLIEQSERMSPVMTSWVVESRHRLQGFAFGWQMCAERTTASSDIAPKEAAPSIKVYSPLELKLVGCNR